MNKPMYMYLNYMDDKAWELSLLEDELDRIRRVKANLEKKEARLLVRIKRLRSALKL